MVTTVVRVDGPSEPTDLDDLGELGERKRLAEQGPDPGPPSGSMPRAN